MGFWKKLLGLEKKAPVAKTEPAKTVEYKVNSVEDIKKLAEPTKKPSAKKTPAKKPAAKKTDAKKAPAKKPVKKTGTGAGGKGSKQAR